MLKVDRFRLHGQQVSVGVDFEVGGSCVVYLWFQLSRITESLSNQFHDMVAIDLVLDGFTIVLLGVGEACF